MDGPLRELAQRKVGTQDFDVGLTRDPKIDLDHLDHTSEVSGTESEEDSPADHCASLYDAIRDMCMYGSEIEEEKRRRNAAGIPRRS